VKYLDAAVRKADAGVLPGQMPGGRWFDAHNACAVYHNILLRELLELFHTLPMEHAFRATLLDALTRGLNQAAEETLAQGYTGTWTDNFARGLHWIGENPRWRDALNANLNASGRNGAPTPGFAIIPVLELAQAGPNEPPAKAWAVEPGVRRDVEYARVGEHSLKLDFHPAANAARPAPLLIYVHGGAWRGGSKDHPPVAALTEKGFALASVEYRLTPVAPFPANVHDLKAAIRFLRARAAEFGCDPKRFVIVGSSAGGHLAALVGVSNGHPELEGEVGGHRGVSSDVQAIVSFYGAANLQTILGQSTPHGLSVRVPALQLLLGGQPDEQPALAQLASPVTHVDAHDPPLLLLHGDADPQMPIEQSRELLAAYQRARRPVEFVVLPGGVHGGKEFYDAERLALVEKFLRERLR
jgi:acetyl esterase/lipase